MKPYLFLGEQRSDLPALAKGKWHIVHCHLSERIKRLLSQWTVVPYHTGDTKILSVSYVLTLFVWHVRSAWTFLLQAKRLTTPLALLHSHVAV